MIMGPALGGLLYVAGPGVVYTVCGALYLVSVMLMARLRYEQAPPKREPATLKTLFAGVHFIRERKDVLGVISLDLFAVLLGGATALLPIFAKDILHTGPWGLGLLRAAPAVGALLMSVWLARHSMQRRRRRDHVCLGRRLRRGHAGVRGVDHVVAVAGRAVRAGRVRHGQHGDPRRAGAAGYARRHARPGQRGECDLHQHLQPARRIRVGHAGRVAGCGGRHGDRRYRHAGGGRPVDGDVPEPAPAPAAARGSRRAGGRGSGYASTSHEPSPPGTAA